MTVPLIITNKDNDTGEEQLWILADPDGSSTGVSTWVSQIETETIVPIDPRVLPEGGVGYIEQGRILTIDDAMDVVKGLGYYVSVEAVDLSRVTKVSRIENGELREYGSRDWLLYTEGPVTALIINRDDGTRLYLVLSSPVLIDDDIPVGTYLVGDVESSDYTKSIEFGEVIHPIDPKYLPEGGFGYTGSGGVVFSGELSENEGSEEFHISQGGTSGPSPALEVGKSYTVTLNSGTYQAVAKIINSNLAGGECCYLGNAGFLLGAEDTGESFLVAEMLEQTTGLYQLMVFDLSRGKFATVTGEEIIHSIDPKFLPEVSEKTLDLAKAYSDSKGGYVEKIAETLVETDLPLYGNNEYYPGTRYRTNVDMQGMVLQEGETYSITTDSGTFIAKAIGYTMGPDEPPIAIFVGSMNIVDPFYWGNGESFVIVTYTDNNRTDCYDANGGTHFKVEKVTEAIVPIDPKYMPDTVATKEYVEQLVIGAIGGSY
jgi:hypothetical protein